MLGVWKLLSFKIKKGQDERDWGAPLKGFLIYTHEGYMSVSANRGEVSEIDRDDMNQVYESFLSYSGTYRVERDSTIVHSVESASDLDKIGKDLVRTYRFIENNKIEIIGRGSFGEATLIWEKIEKLDK